MTFSTNTIILSGLAEYELTNEVFSGPNTVSVPSPGPSVCLVIAVDPGALTTSQAPPTYASIELVVVL